MSADKIEQLSQISDQLDTLIASKSGVSPKSFWAGIGLTLAGMLATLFLTFGALQSDVHNHIDGVGHITEKQKQEITLNTQHRIDFTRKSLDNLFATKNDLDDLEKRVDNLEEDHDN